ncbi:MAG TPA: porin [Methylobacter sp.]|jgi:phosphate-selective porin OprO/OprP
MKISKLTLAVATVLGASATTGAFAMDLYVDTKTKQIYAEPGRGRELMGSFEKVDKAPAKTVEKEEKLDKAEIAKIREDLALKDNAIKALQEHAEAASAPSAAHVKLDDGIHFATNDGNFTAGINGRIQVDSQTNVNQNLANNFLPGAAGTPATLNDGVGLRRARLGVEGTFFKNSIYKFEYDFTRGNGTTGAGVTDAYIGHNFSKPFQVKVGAFKEPFSLEEATSNRYLTFIERNMATNAFIDDLNTYKMGIGASYAQERWQAATSLQTEPVGANGASNSSTNSNGGSNRSGGSGDTNWEVNARVTGMPWMESKTKFLHVGASGSYINVNNNYLANGTFSNGGISYARGLDNNVDRTNILNTSNLTSGTKGTAAWREANHLTRFGAESALVYGPFSAQGEYIATNVSGHGYNDGETLDGYYGYVSYFLTGESRAYKSKTGAWDRLKPNRNFDMKGGWGAWELATGYDSINLNSGAIKGGRASTAKFGVNWYPNSHVRVMANYVHALDINTAGVANTTSAAFNNADLDVLETRVQLDW